MKKILLCLVAVLTATVSFAQHERGTRERQREFNPEEVAQRRTLQLHRVVLLDSTQYQAVLLMNYADALTMQDSIKARRERMEKMRAEGKRPERTRPDEEQIKAMMELQKERESVRNEQMKQILTPEQYEKYLKYNEEQRNRMREARGRGRGQRGNRMPRQ